ncbi:helix-turn-helix transcriptional regulator [Hydrogenimonas sp. SS33]|uniref:helix-turn-helix transcriptional regulator n=1 Tax=Hydrogenimonas leucolamina TaxID=2954236 RepID=UPI00336BB6B8
MESLFFNAGEKRYRRGRVSLPCGGTMLRIDISNALVVFETLELGQKTVLPIEGLERMALLAMVEQGGFSLQSRNKATKWEAKAGDSLLFTSGRQAMRLHIFPDSRLFAVAVSDFFLKRYCSGRLNDPVDFLYNKMQNDCDVCWFDRVPVDALSLYLIRKITQKAPQSRSLPMRAEHDAMELLLHRFELIDMHDETLESESLRIAKCARAHLLKRFADPPTIVELARMCATNPTTLKRAFKKVYAETIGAYVRRLRLQRANQLLRDHRLSIAEVAERVGFRHHGHFSRLFFEAYGFYPKDLK